MCECGRRSRMGPSTMALRFATRTNSQTAWQQQQLFVTNSITIRWPLYRSTEREWESLCSRHSIDANMTKYTLNRLDSHIYIYIFACRGQSAHKWACAATSIQSSSSILGHTYVQVIILILHYTYSRHHYSRIRFNFCFFLSSYFCLALGAARARRLSNWITKWI